MSGSQTLRVDRAATGDGQVKETKTHETRTVDLTPDVVATLKRHLTWLRAEALRLGTGEPEWLFPRADDTLVNKNYAAGVFRRILKRAGLPHYRVYDLRHTFASLLLAESAPITYVSAQLGHSSPASTMRFYARWLPSQGKRWVNALDRKTRPRVAAEGNMEPESGTRTGGIWTARRFSSVILALRSKHAGKDGAVRRNRTAPCQSSLPQSGVCPIKTRVCSMEIDVRSQTTNPRSSAEPASEVCPTTSAPCRTCSGRLFAGRAEGPAQPWPFPSSLMIGFLAEALTEEITVDPEELSEARWFHRDEIREMADDPARASLPAPIAIAHHICRRWSNGLDSL